MGAIHLQARNDSITTATYNMGYVSISSPGSDGSAASRIDLHAQNLMLGDFGKDCYTQASGPVVSDDGFMVGQKDIDAAVPLLKVATVTKDNFTIAKSSTGSGTFSATEYLDYTPIGIVGFDLSNGSSSGTGLGSQRIVAVTCNTSGTISWQIRNDSSSQAKLKLTVRVLYVASGASLG